MNLNALTLRKRLSIFEAAGLLGGNRQQIIELMREAIDDGELLAIEVVRHGVYSSDHGTLLTGGAIDYMATFISRVEVDRWSDAVGLSGIETVIAAPVLTEQAESKDVAQPLQRGDAKDAASLDKTEKQGHETDWRMRIQAEAWEHWLRLRASGCNPTVYGICDWMAQWCIDQNVIGGKGQNPRAGTIRNTVLGAGHWTPPTHSVQQAKAYIAQIAQTAQTKVA